MAHPASADAAQDGCTGHLPDLNAPLLCQQAQAFAHGQPDPRLCILQQRQACVQDIRLNLVPLLAMLCQLRTEQQLQQQSQPEEDTLPESSETERAVRYQQRCSMASHVLNIEIDSSIMKKPLEPQKHSPSIR